MNVIVADQKPALAVLIQEYLRREYGWTVCNVARADDLTAKMTAFSVGLVIIRISLPLASSASIEELVETMRQRSPGVKIIAISGGSQELTRARGLFDASFNGLLKLSELSNVLNCWMGSL